MNVLVAEDDRVARLMLERQLSKWGYAVMTAADGTQAWEALQKPDAPRLVLLDWIMPGLEGVQICRELRKRLDQPYVYVLLLTAKTEKEEVLEGLQAGADDYLVKPCDPDELRARLRTGKRILDLQAQLLSANEAIRVQATHDSLTGLYNRGAVLEILERELARSRREHSALGVVLADVDHFKQVNDVHGHQAGDAVLQGTAARMKATVRPYDAVGRYGGEEFLIVIPNCKSTALVNQAERIRAAIQSRPFGTARDSIAVTLSLGVMCTDLDASGDSDALLRAADAALYRAKRGGRNRVELATAFDCAGQTV